MLSGRFTMSSQPLRILPRPLCPDLEPSCFQLVFGQAWWCAMVLRNGLTGPLAYCPIHGSAAVATYPSPGPVPRPPAPRGG
jgi:hypothetical protein